MTLLQPDKPVLLLVYPDMVIRQAYQKALTDRFSNYYDIKAVDNWSKALRVAKQKKIAATLLAPETVITLSQVKKDLKKHHDSQLVVLLLEMGREEVKDYQQAGALVCSLVHSRPEEVCACLEQVLAKSQANVII